MKNKWNDIKCNKCGNTISVHLGNNTYREYPWRCEKCGNEQKVKFGVSILNGDTKAEVEINNLERIIKKAKVEMKVIYNQINEDLARIKFIKENPDKTNIRVIRPIEYGDMKYYIFLENDLNKYYITLDKKEMI